MSERGQRGSALRPTEGYWCMVVVCTDAREAEQIGRELLQLNTLCLITYRRTEDLLLNAPRAAAVLFILAACESPTAIARTLQWARSRWPRCPLAVLGTAGGGEEEVAARLGGAAFLTRPVSQQDWAALVSQAEALVAASAR